MTDRATAATIGSRARAARRGVLLVAAALVPQLAVATTTVGDGSNPAGGTVAPGSSARALDAFTLQTDGPTDAIASATVTLAGQSWMGLAAVSIQDTIACNQATPPGTVAPTSSTVVVPLAGVTASATLAAYYVCVAPKAHSAMPVPPGTEHVVTGTVTSISSGGAVTYADTASATLTVDNRSPGNVAWGTIQPSSGQVSLAWVPPADADFADLVVLRNEGAPVVDRPDEGATLAPGAILANSRVACAQATGPCVDSGLVDGVAYHYKAFARDSNGNYAVGIAAGPVFTGANPLPVGSPDPTRPMIAIVNPGNGAVVSGGTVPAQPFRVQVRVWSRAAAIQAVEITTDAGGSWTPLSQSPNYGGTATSGIWEGQLTVATGSYSLVARARNDAATWINSAPVGVVVKPARTGDGHLVVRDNSSALCADCHAFKAHGSDGAGTTYGSWATVCRDCHTPHGTTNIYLIRTQITPPPRGADVPTPKDVVFLSPTGYADAAGPSYEGVCQVCHRSTSLFKADGTGTSHYGDTCADCHKCKDGLAPTCTSCHGAVGRGATVTGADPNLAAAPPALATPAATGSVANGAHLAHLDRAAYRAAPLQCADCHATNAHRDGAADVAWGPLARSNGFVPSPATGPVASAGWPATPTCANWCHGDGLPDGGRGLTWSWNVAVTLACNSCHGQAAAAMPALSATSHHPQNPDCAACHGAGYATTGLSDTAKGTHLDGTIQRPANGCRACHGDLSQVAAPSTDPAAAPGYTPGLGVDTRGNGAVTARGVGAHSAHVSGTTFRIAPLPCSECHFGSVPADGDTSHATGSVSVAGGPLATDTGLSTTPTLTWNGTTCANTYCHGNIRNGKNATETWAQDITLDCNSCHASPPTGTHPADSDCNACHPGYAISPPTVVKATHIDGMLQVGGPDCLSCHGATGKGTLRAVTADFADGTSPNFRSHHVGNGTTNTLRGTLTNNDCWICHAEYDAAVGGTGAKHLNGTIDLRNADAPATAYAYDKRSMPASAAAWNSGDATWRSQTSTSLDPFCLSCHDSNGASGLAGYWEGGATAQNPFNDTRLGTAGITNNYDQLLRPSIVNVQSKVSGNPPTQGTFARHAIRGQSTSKYANYLTASAWSPNPNGYSTVYSANRFVALGLNDENGRPLWNDTSVMGCADCHTVDGANGAAGNAHGSGSEYLLKDSSGGATKGAGTTAICLRCHVSTYEGNTAHTGGSTSDYVTTVGAVGPANRTAGRGSVFGLSCTNCHGGADGNQGASSTTGFGWIHGTNQTFGTGPGGGSGTRNAYRFTNGGGLRYYAPGNNTTWDTGTGSCVTLGGADTWSGCAQHGTAPRAQTPATLKRPLSY